MSTSLATLVCWIGILGLFYLDRDKSVRTSKALWIPLIWFLILGSRPVSMWLGTETAADPTVAQQVEGSPTERIVYTVLIGIGLLILIRRGRHVFSLLAANWPVILYFSFCLLSVAWSDYSGVAIKRWFKACGDVIMILVIVTDAQPVAALQRLFSRIGFVLLPLSVLFIKYYPALGRSFDSWTGEPFNTGVTTNKNSLGLLSFLIGLGAVWALLQLWRNRETPNRSRRLFVQCTLLGFAIWLLFNAHSATSGACFTLGAGLMLASGSRKLRGRSYAIHALVVSVLFLAGFMALTGTYTAVLQILGRNPDLTGRASEVWPTVIPMNPNALLGAGFESFWMGPRLQYLWDKMPHLFLNEAHNGYIEVYLNLGLIGVALIALILVDGYRKAVAAFRVDPDSSSLMLAFTLTLPVYSLTEAGFRMLAISWSFLLLAIFGASRISEMASEKVLADPLASVAWPTSGVRTMSMRVKT